MTPYTSIAIRIVRFPLAVLVVFIHSVRPTDNIAYYPFRDFFSHTFCSFVVPAFFHHIWVLVFSADGEWVYEKDLY